YQIQEMLRVEHIDREPDIQHELATYNALLGGPGQLGCCLLIEIEDPVVRDRRLREWRALPAYVYMRCEGGATVRPTVDPDQITERRISAVHNGGGHAVGDAIQPVVPGHQDHRDNHRRRP